MSTTEGVSLLRRVRERLDAAERLLLKPERTSAGALVGNLEAGWGELCALDRLVRGGGAEAGWRAEIEEIRERARRVTWLLEQYGELVEVCRMADEGSYTEAGRVQAAGWAVRPRVDEEG